MEPNFELDLPDDRGKILNSIDPLNQHRETDFWIVSKFRVWSVHSSHALRKLIRQTIKGYASGPTTYQTKSAQRISCQNHAWPYSIAPEHNALPSSDQPALPVLEPSTVFAIEFLRA